MCRTMTKSRWGFNPSAKADAERYRRYHAAKAKIPKTERDRKATEYTERVKKLARRYHV